MATAFVRSGLRSALRGGTSRGTPASKRTFSSSSSQQEEAGIPLSFLLFILFLFLKLISCIGCDGKKKKLFVFLSLCMFA